MSEQDNIPRKRLSRRSLMAATGAAIAGGFVPARAAAQGPAAQPSKPTQSMGGPRADRWYDYGFKNTTWAGKKGFQLQMEQQTRSAPLCWIQSIVLKVDGEQYDPRDILIVHNSRQYTFEELAHLGDVGGWREVPWWQMFELITVFVPRATPLSPGEHAIEGVLVRYSYIPTVGRTGTAAAAKQPPTQRLVLQTE